MTTPSTNANLSNLIRFLVAFISAAWGVSQGKADLGAFIGFLMVVLHFKKCHHLLAEYKTVLTTLLIGGIWEGILIQQHIVSYGNVPIFATVPIWLLVTWSAFGSTLNGSLSGLRNHQGWAAILGAITGPLLGYGASVTGVMSMEEPLRGYLILSAGWALILPLLTRLARYYSENSEFIDREVGR